jgi:hypothetical protein
LLHHAELKLCFWLIHMLEIFKFECGLVGFEFNRRNKKKMNKKFRFKRKTETSPVSPLPRHFGPLGLGQPRVLASLLPLPGGANLSAPTSQLQALPLSLRRGSDPSVSCCFPPRARASTLWARPVSSVLPATTADLARARTPRKPTTMRPTFPNSLLSPARTRSLTPASFHPLPSSLALSRRRPSLPVIRTRRADHLELQTPCPASPSTVPR